MKKNIKKSLKILFIFLIMLSNISVCALSKNIDNLDNEIYDAVLKEAYGDNYKEYLEDNWHKVEIAAKVEDLIEKYYKNIFPEYYGGMYISDDAKNLIIQIVKENIPKSDSKEYKIYNELINIDSSIKIEYVKLSQNELSKIIDVIGKSETINKNKNYISSYIDVMSNSIVVEVKNNNDMKTKQTFKETFANLKSQNKAYDYIKFVNSTEDQPLAGKTLNAGSAISVHGGTCSMGFRVKYNGNKGYLTAGHCFDGLLPSIPTGTIQIRQFANNQSNDYAFVKTTALYEPMNTLQYPGTNITELAVANYCPTLVVNMAVAKSGMKTGYTAGKITALSYDAQYKNIKIKNLVKAQLKSNCGDSGAPIFTPRTQANGGPVPIGILSGGNTRDECKTPATYTLFTNINRLPANLQTGRY